MIEKFKKLRSRIFAHDEATIRQLEKKVKRLQAIVDVFVQEQSYDPGSRAGLNDQEIRKSIIEKICDEYHPEIVIETGTFFGLSSGYFASNLGVPVYTAEIDKTYFQVAKYLLRNIEGIHQYLMDSRQFLRELARDEELRVLKPLIYLDAHWYEDLPLREELKIVFSAYDSPIVVVDDFQVPWDNDYLFDDYGHGRALTVELIKDIVGELELVLFFPIVPASEESGGKRGCVVIARKEMLCLLEGVKELDRLKLT